MGSKKILFLVVVSCFLLFPISPTYYATEAAAAKDPEKVILPASSSSTSSSSIQSQLVIDDFCNQRSTREDMLFCALVFEPNLQTRTIKDNFGLLRVGLQFAIGNAMKTKDFLKFLSDNDEEKESSNVSPSSPPLMKQLPAVAVAVLEQCLAAYSDYIKDLKVITVDLEDDPPMVNYDSRMAAQALSRCHNSLAASKIHDDSILGRNKVAERYSKLIQEISKIV